MIVLLDNIRSIFNVGAIFRTCDGAGVDELILGGFTPHPPMDKLNKTSLGAIDFVKWQHLDNTTVLKYLHQQKKNKIKIISIEQSKISQNYTTAQESGIMTWDSTIYIFGNEISGVSKNIVNISDYVLEIPMYGQKNSLNVSVSVGVIVYASRKYKETKETRFYE